MNLKYTHKKEEDIWCLLNKGKSSNNSPTPTKIYKELIQFKGENLDDVSTSKVFNYLTNDINFLTPSIAMPDSTTTSFHTKVRKVSLRSTNQ